jgi:hypothetical protein
MTYFYHWYYPLNYAKTLFFKWLYFSFKSLNSSLRDFKYFSANFFLISRINFTASIFFSVQHFFSIQHLYGTPYFQKMITLHKIYCIEFSDTVKIHDLFEIPANQNINVQLWRLRYFSFLLSEKQKKGLL